MEHHLQVGTYVVVEAGHDYVRHCIEEYGFLPDENNDYMALYRPTHIIGMELGISVASVALRGEATGAATGWRSDAIATAKRGLQRRRGAGRRGRILCLGQADARGASLAMGGLPLGLASGVKLKRDIAEGEAVGWADVDYDEKDEAVVARREMETAFAPALGREAAE